MADSFRFPTDGDVKPQLLRRITSCALTGLVTQRGRDRQRKLDLRIQSQRGGDLEMVVQGDQEGERDDLPTSQR